MFSEQPCIYTSMKFQQGLVLTYIASDVVETFNDHELVKGPRTRVGQPKMKYWKLHELHKNEVKNTHML